MAAAHRRSLRTQYARRLRAETLEHRRVLNGAGWFGSLIHDQTGDMFTIDLLGDMSVEYLGQADEIFFDTAFSPSGDLYGASVPWDGPSKLYRIDIDFQSTPPVINTTEIDEVKLANGDAVVVNGLEFRDDGVLFGAGFNDETDEESLFTINTGTGIATEQLALEGHQSAGDLVFDTDGYIYVSTLAAELVRIDPDLTAATVMGSLVSGDFYGLTYAPAPLMYGFPYWTNDVYRINPVDATCTFVTTLAWQDPSGDPALGGILGAASIFEPPTDLGEVDFLELTDQQPILGQLWYRLETVHDGYLTADLPGATAGSGVGLKLYTLDGDGALQEVTSGELRLDHDSALAGEEYYLQVSGADAGVDLRLTNLVSPTPEGAVVYGTDQMDVFEYEVGPPTLVWINEVDYEFDFSALETAYVSFLGGDGYDAALLAGSDGGADEALLGPDSGTMTGSGYAVEVADTNEIVFSGVSGDDWAGLSGSAEADEAWLWPNAAELSGTGFRLVAVDTPTIEVFADTGDDTLTIEGSSDPETVEYWPGDAENADYAKLSGADFQGEAWEFETVEAFSGGGADQLIVHDSTGPDQFAASSELALFDGPGVSLTAHEFPAIEAYASEGGFDVVKLFDSPEPDEFVANATYAGLFGGGLKKEVWNFEQVHAYATSTGDDVARLYDSPQSDIYRANPIEAAMFNGVSLWRAKHFEQVHAFSTAGGEDTAELSGSDANDYFYGDSIQAAMDGQGYFNRVKFFESVDADAAGGDDNQAKLHDSPLNDEFGAKGDYARFHGDRPALYGDKFDNEIRGFQQIKAYADADGSDRAKLFDTADNDEFAASRGYAQISGGGVVTEVYGFEQAHAYATDIGLDVAKLFDSVGNDVFYADPTEGYLYNDDLHFLIRAKHFEEVHGYATLDGEDEAYLSGSDQDDTFLSDPIFGALYNENLPFLNRAKHFEKVYADAGADGYDEAYLNDSVEEVDLLEAVAAGNWVRLSCAALDYLYEVADFDFVQAHASTDGDTADVPALGQLDFTLDMGDDWQTPP